MNRRFLIVAVLIGATAAAVTWLNLTVKVTTASDQILHLPKQVGRYIGVDLPVEQRIVDILETPNILMRDYIGPDKSRISVAIVYYPQYRVYFHMPEGCMAGSGSVLLSKGQERVDVPGWNPQSAVANKLVFEQRTGNEIALYFFESGSMVTPQYTKMRWHMMKNHIMRRQTGAALVRFSIRTNNGDTQHALEVLKEFMGRFIPILPDYLP